MKVIFQLLSLEELDLNAEAKNIRILSNCSMKAYSQRRLNAMKIIYLDLCFNNRRMHVNIYKSTKYLVIKKK